MSKKSLLPLSLSLGILALLVYISGPEKVIDIILRANIFYVLLGFCLWLCSIFIRTVRWRILLKNVKSFPDFFSAMKVLLAGLGVSNITPGKVGDPIRAYFLKKKTGDEFSRVVSSIFVERVSDFFATLTLGLFSLVLISGTGYFKLFLIAIGIYILLFFSGIYILASERRTKKAVNFLFRFFKVIPKIREKQKEIESFSRNIHSSFITYKNKKILAVTFVLTLSIWILESLILYLALISIGSNVSPFIIVTVAPLIVVISVLTFLPGGLGSGDALIVFIFSSLTGVTYSQLTAATILSRLASFWPCVFIGMYFAAKIKISIK